jgi:hypothetical protein
MSLPDHIERLCNSGAINQPFSVADVQHHLKGVFATHYIKTALANYARGTGNYVKRWSRPRFRRGCSRAVQDRLMNRNALGDEHTRSLRATTADILTAREAN